MKYLLDTCVISELVATNPNKQVVKWVDDVDEQLLTLSVITLGEIKRGIEKLPESKRKQRLNEWLVEDLLIRFDEKILSIDTAVMLAWGALVARMERQGRTMPAIDSLIAAIASHYNLQLVTRNEKDFAGSGVKVFNPWNE
jgi:predicted nucleic acid-binding protein